MISDSSSDALNFSRQIRGHRGIHRHHPALRHEEPVADGQQRGLDAFTAWPSASNRVTCAGRLRASASDEFRLR